MNSSVCALGAALLLALPSVAWAQGRALSFAKIGVTIPSGTAWAELQVEAFPLVCQPLRKLTWQGKAGDTFQDHELEGIFREQAGRAGIKLAGDNNNLFERDQKSAELQVGALITGIKAEFCTRRNLAEAMLARNRVTTSGSVTMNVEWQVYSTLEDRVVARIPTTGQYLTKTGIDGGRSLFLQRAFGDAARAFSASPELQRLVTTPVASGATPTPLTPLVFIAPRHIASKPSEVISSVVTVFAGEAMGSAFLISPEGYLLTNHHVVGDAARVRVRWADQTESVGEVLRSNRRRDVALVKVDAAERRALSLRSAALQPGETVFAIGTPLEKDFQNTVTRGVVSGNRILEGLSFVQSDVAVDHGNSGGPLIDESGRVVAITQWGYEPDGVSHNLNFFIPIDDALKALALAPAS